MELILSLFHLSSDSILLNDLSSYLEKDQSERIESILIQKCQQIVF